MSQITKKHLVGHEIRPRFKVETVFSMADLTAKIKAKLESDNANCKGHVYPGYAKLYMPLELQHYWSPQLTLTFEETENGTTLRGLYGPRPTVWTMFVFFYALIAFAILVVSVIGLSYLTLDKSANILWVLPLLAALFASLYFVAYSGQKLGQDEMVTIHHFLEEGLGLSI